MSDTCAPLDVPVATCYIRFSDATNQGSRELPFRTVRGEMLLADFDKDGRVIGIELVGPGKPCQETP